MFWGWLGAIATLDITRRASVAASKAFQIEHMKINLLPTFAAALAIGVSISSCAYNPNHRYNLNLPLSSYSVIGVEAAPNQNSDEWLFAIAWLGKNGFQPYKECRRITGADPSCTTAVVVPPGDIFVQFQAGLKSGRIPIVGWAYQYELPAADGATPVRVKPGTCYLPAVRGLKTQYESKYMPTYVPDSRQAYGLAIKDNVVTYSTGKAAVVELIEVSQDIKGCEKLRELQKG